MLVILFMLCGSLLIVHEYPIASAPYRGTPDAYQLLRDNPETKTIEISASTLEDVLNDFQRQRSSYLSAVTKAAIFNVIAIILCFVIYRMQRKQKTFISNDKSNT